MFDFASAHNSNRTEMLKISNFSQIVDCIAFLLHQMVLK